ncbi:Follistatin [Orchesella cincta]|uniref:Follistatin n=1 Tax=Orchesella cincta TaxID=48709 RepID=A0A1D2NIY4_ORCCI|nr:Follistatin [Orchesella cincta]
MNRNGRCTSLVKTGVSREECCSTGSLANSATASWSDGELLTPSSIFFMHVQGGVPCTRCKATCDGVQCPENQKCVIRNGLPKCVCSPNCNAFRLQNGMQNHRGPICGSDGRTYKSPCRLLKRVCRKKETGLHISYFGPCRMSCSKVTCPAKKRCLLDQNMIPHCVNCTLRKCPVPTEKRSARTFCGVDGITYPSMCHLRQAACKQGKAIPVAYRGICRKRANCRNIKCLEGQTCLTELFSQKPRCVTCFIRPKWCKANSGRLDTAPTGPICSTNGKTYKNWCEMTDDACSTGVALDTKYFGECSADNSTIFNEEENELLH